MHARLEADVVDVGVRVVIAAARHRDVELARQIRPHGVAALASLLVERDQVVERLANGARVHHAEVVDAREGRADHVAHVVERRVEARVPARVQAVDDLVGVLEHDPAQLDVLTCRDVDDAKLGAVRLERVGVEAEAVRVDNAVGEAHAHHEAAGRAFVAVHQADPLETSVHIHLLHTLPVQRAGADRSGKLVDVVERVRSILGQLGLLDWVALPRTLHRLLGQEGGARATQPVPSGA